LTVKGNKKIYIPGGKETSIGTLQLEAGSHVEIMNAGDLAGSGQPVRAALAAMNEAEYNGWATLVIWDHFNIPNGATFDLIGRVRLIFRQDATATVENGGTFTVEKDGSVLLEDGGDSGEELAAGLGLGEADVPTIVYEPKTPVGTPGAPVTREPTDDIEFVLTDDYSDGLTPENVDPVDGTHVNWTWTVTEKGEVSFGVWKKASQTVTIEGANTTVSEADAGVTADDGEGAGDELALFTVKTEIWDADTRTSNLFYGTGTFDIGGSTYAGNGFADTTTLTFDPVSFTLVVSEEGYDSKTVAVTVNVETDLTGVAIFKVEDESLQRIPGQNIKKWNDPAQTGTDMIDAIAWIDTTNTEGGEYLVRVESSEAIPKTVISGRAENADTEIRLRALERSG
jgi:hypothetical protein